MTDFSKRKPTEREQDALRRWFEDWAGGMGFISGESKRNTVSDRDGNAEYIGGEEDSVFLDAQNIPRTVSERRSMYADCGHIIHSPADIVGRCGYGHILCHRHKLFRCAECRRTLCELEAVEQDGKLVCPDHVNSGNGLFSGFLANLLWATVIVAVYIALTAATRH